MFPRRLLFLAVAVLTIVIHIQGRLDNDLRRSPFEIAMETLQKQIGYTFQSINLLRRALTHASFSEENNKALSILGSTIIDTSVALKSLTKNIEISPKELNIRISETSNVESSCAIDGALLGLHKVVRVSPKTNSTAPAVVCGAFRAIFGAIAIDSGKSDDAGKIFWDVHGAGDLDFAKKSGDGEKIVWSVHGVGSRV